MVPYLPIKSKDFLCRRGKFYWINKKSKAFFVEKGLPPDFVSRRAGLRIPHSAFRMKSAPPNGGTLFSGFAVPYALYQGR
jgi:hypothetical protein